MLRRTYLLYICRRGRGLALYFASIPSTTTGRRSARYIPPGGAVYTVTEQNGAAKASTDLRGKGTIEGKCPRIHGVLVLVVHNTKGA